MRAEWIEANEVACDAASLHAEGIVCEAFAPGGLEAHVARFKADRDLENDGERSLGDVGPRADADSAREADEHAHMADEVRLIVEGQGVYDVRARDERWIRIWVAAGDVVVIPRHRYHRFLVGPTKVTWREIYGGPTDLTPLFRGSEDSTRAV